MREILNSAGIDPAPRWTDPSWKQLLANQARGLIAADFFNLDTALGKRLYSVGDLTDRYTAYIDSLMARIAN